MVHETASPVLTRGSTAEELAAVLRDMIFRGELLPDAPMREAALSEQFEVSRRTVRESLSLLGQAGLVRHHRHKGSRVTQLRADDIHDLYCVRRTLELAAAVNAAQAPAERRDALTAAYGRLSEATKIGHAHQIVAHDLEFHQAVVGLLVSPRMDQFFAGIALEMRFGLTILEASSQESRRRPKAALDEHRAIYEALVVGDADAAAALISEHIDVNERMLVAAVTRGDAAPGKPSPVA